MRGLVLVSIIAFMAGSLGLNAQGKDTAQTEPQVKLELIWEKEFPEGIADVAIDKERGGLFCPSVVVTGNCENAQEILFFDTLGRVERRMKLKEWSQVRISENSKYIGIMHPEKWDGEFHYGPVEIIDLSGKLVKKIGTVYGTWWWVSPKGDEVIVKDIWSDEDIFYFKGTPGKDKANLTTGEGDVEMFAGMPAIKWSGTESEYLQIDNYTTNLPCRLHSSLIAISPNGQYIATPGLRLYTKHGKLLKKFNLKKKGETALSFSADNKLLAATVKNTVILINVETKEILWEYESNDSHQLLNLKTTLDFSLKEPLYLAGIFWHYEKAGFIEPSERIIVFSKKGMVLLEQQIGNTLNRLGRVVFNINRVGDQLCYVTHHKIRVFQLRREQ